MSLNLNHPRYSPGVILVEIALIMIGIFLGLAGNEWRLHRADQVRIDRALTHIQQELKANQKMVERISPYHSTMSDSLQILIRHIDESQNSIPFMALMSAMPRGFGVPSLQNNAWTLANRLGIINHLDYDLATELSRIYSLQNFYLEKYDRVADNLYVASNIRPESRNGLAIGLAMLASDIVIHEKDLAEEYNIVLALLAEN